MKALQKSIEMPLTSTKIRMFVESLVLPEFGCGFVYQKEGIEWFLHGLTGRRNQVIMVCNHVFFF